MKLDNTSKIVLLALLVFFVWLGLQWDPSKVTDESMDLTSSDSEQVETSNSSDSQTSTSPTERSEPYVSGFSGEVLLNNEIYSENSLLTSQFVLKTKGDSWAVIELNTNDFIILFENSELIKNDNQLDLIKGKVYFSGDLTKWDIKSLEVNSFTSVLEKNELTIITEPNKNKVRVFALNGGLSFNLKNKSYSSNDGIGRSIFIARNSVSEYELRNGVDYDLNGGTYNWREASKSVKYYTIHRVITKSMKEIFIETEITETTDISMNVGKLDANSTTIHFSVFSENSFGSWTRSAK